MNYSEAKTIAAQMLRATPGTLDYRPQDRARNVRVAIEPYPATVAECLRPVTYKGATRAAMRAFRDAKPFRGTDAERFEKLAALHIMLCEAYGVFPSLHRSARHEGGSGSSCFRPGPNAITLDGRLSVITYLHEFAHALGKGERGACVWSLNLFREHFPQSFARLNPSGHTLTR